MKKFYNLWAWPTVIIKKIPCSTSSPRDSNTFNQVAGAKMFEGVFLCRKVY